MNHIIEELNLLSEIALKAYTQGLAAGSGGNVSIRLGERIYISPSGVCLGELSKEDYICLDLNGTQLSEGKPSKETGMHLECYRSRPDIGSVIHLHPIYSIAATCSRSINGAGGIPVYTPGYALRIGRIPVIPYLKPGSEALARAVSDTISCRDSVLLGNHGAVTVGTNPADAFHLIEEIEENAQIAVLLGRDGIAMTDEQIAEMNGR